MSVNSTFIIRALFGGALLVGGGAMAQVGDGRVSDVARARLQWAERHAEVVCRPLAERGEAGKAARCLDRVARVRAEATGGREATGSLGIAQTIDVPIPAPRPSRCSGISCIERLSFIGASY